MVILPLAVSTIVFYAIYLAASAAISYGIGYLIQQMTRKPVAGVPGQQPTLSTRGSPLTLLLGRRRVAPVVCFLGDRINKRTDEKAYYKEVGMHALCLGPVDALYEIYDGGKRGLKDIGTLYRETTPSGSSFSIQDYGTFRIYWGDNTQPVDARLEELSGVGSMWPGVCYIVWDHKTVNPGWVWNQMEYVVERRLTTETPLADSPAWIDRTTRPVRGSIRDDGVNPAHAIWFFLTAPTPYGLGMKADTLDGGAFEQLGELCAAEHLPVNILARDGVTGSQVLTELMTEVGFVLPQIGAKLVPVIVRPPGGETLPQLTIDSTIDPVPEITQQHGDTSPSRSTYLINDENNEYKPSDVTEDNDAQARNRGAIQPKQVVLNNITDRLTGYEVAQRLMQDDSVDGTSFDLQVLRARDLQPGQLFVIPNFGTLRVASRKPDMMSTRTTIEAVLDQYGRRLHDYYPNGVGNPLTRDTYHAEDDPYVVPFLLPNALNPYSGPSLWVLRVRANQGTIGALVFLSSNGTSYHNTGVDEGHVLGGTLNRPILFDEPTHLGGVPTSPVTMTPFNADTDEVEDNVDDDAAWEAGDQIVVIEAEIFLCSRLFPVPGGFRIDGMRRAQYGTTAVTHPQGSLVFVFKASNRTVFNSGLIQTGVDLRVKTTPYTAVDGLPLESATPHEVTIP
jgi:hypothetical protein